MGGELGTPVSTNPNALYYNPGALGFSEGTQFGMYGGGTLRVGSFKKDPSAKDTTDPPDAKGATTGTAYITHPLAGLNAIGASTRIGNLVLGLGYFAPFTGIQRYDQNDTFKNSKYPLAVGGPARFYGTYVRDVTLYFTLGAAYRLGPVSIGATGNLTSTTVTSSGSRTFGGTGLPDTANEGKTELKVFGLHGSFAVGAMVEVLPDQIWIGGSYQAQPGLGQVTLTGDKGNLRNDYPKAGGGLSPARPLDAKQIKSYPDAFRLGVRFRPKRLPLELRVFGDLTRYSKQNDGICVGVANAPCGVNPDGSPLSGSGTTQFIRMKNNDSVGVRLGVSYWTSPAVELLMGAGFETASTTAATMSPLSHDADNIQGTFGARFKVTRMTALSIEYTHYYFFTRDNTGQSELAQLNGVKVAYPTIQEDGGGVYKEWRAQVNGSFEVMF
jgi:long-chain fatty acid transport protein